MYEEYTKVKIICKEGAIDTLQSIVEKEGFNRGILITDKFFSTNGVAEKIIKNTKSIVCSYTDCLANPSLLDAEKVVSIMKDYNVDFAVALGGGSSLDIGKFACSLFYGDSRAADYFYGKKFNEQHIPLIAVPTTAGTGSEVTGVSVMSNSETGEKAPVCSANFFPYMAIVDSDFTLSVPSFITAATGIDAIAHALESYWCNSHNEKSDEMALSALNRLFKNIEKAYQNGNDRKARFEMSQGALEAGIAFAPTRTAGIHASSYPLSEQCHLCHGEACGVTLDGFILYNSNIISERMENLSKKLGFNNSSEMAAKVKTLKEKFGLKVSIPESDEEKIKAIAEGCLKHPLMKNNPAIPSIDDMVLILKGAYAK